MWGIEGEAFWGLSKMTPIQRLVEVCEACGLTPLRSPNDDHGPERTFAFNRPMPKSVRKMGKALSDLEHNFWMAGENGLTEGFSDFKRNDSVQFPAPMFSMERLGYYFRRFKLRMWKRRNDRLVSQLKRQMGAPNTPKVHLDSSRIGPTTSEYQKIEAANAIIFEKVSEAAEAQAFRLRWSYGNSSHWRVILSVGSEEELMGCIAEQRYAGFARKVVGLIEEVVQLAPSFKLYTELDSDERVTAAEGWFFRLKADPQPGREFVFELNIGELIELRSPMPDKEA